MALQPSISLQVQPASLGSLGTGFDEGLNDVNAYRKGQLQKVDVQNAQREQAGQSALRGVLSQTDPNDPDYLNKVQSSLQGQGFGDVAQDFVAKARQGQAQLAQTKATTNQNQTQRLKEITDLRNGIISSSTSLAMNAKTPEEKQSIKNHLIQQIQGLKSANPDIAASAPDEFDTSDIEAHDFNDAASLRPYTYLGLAPADRQKYMQTDKFLDTMGTSLTPGDHAANLKKLNDAAPALIAANPELEKAVTAKANNEKANWWNEIKPTLDQIRKDAGNTSNQTQYNALTQAIDAAIPAELQGYPEADKYRASLEKNKPNPPPSFAAISMEPVPQSVIQNAAKRIADGNSTVSEEINKGRFTGQKAMQVHDDLVNAVTTLKPDFSEVTSESGFNFAKNPSTKRAVAQLDNAYSTVKRLSDVYSKLDNTQFPTLNKAINAGKVQTGDVDAARASIAEVLGNDELTQAFARGGMGSDKLRDMSAALANKNMSPSQATAQFNEILQGVDRSRQAYENGSNGYIKPPKYRQVQTQTSDLDKTDPKVKAALDAGYTEQQVKDYLASKK